MGILDGSVRGRNFRRKVLWMLLGIFALRALIPLGYMPDFASLSKGSLKVVICTGAGSRTILLDAAGNPVPAKHSGKTDHPCAFTGMAVAALPFADHALIGRREDDVSIILPISNELRPSKVGPVLGARGPPLAA